MQRRRFSVDPTVALVAVTVAVCALALWDAIPRLLDRANLGATPVGALFDTGALIGAHFVAVSLITVLALPGRPTWAERAVIVALLVAGGVVVELAQVTFTANRGFEEIDVAANVWGSLAGTVVVWLADRTAARPTAARLGP